MRNTNFIFKQCVILLEKWAAFFHISYQEINVIIFCVIEPIIFFGMLYIIIKQYNKLKTKTK